MSEAVESQETVAILPAYRANTAALIPAYLEERFIAKVVQGAREQVETVLVVDDGSRDATSSQASIAGAEVVKHARNSGKGAALKSGFQWMLARGIDYVVCLDGDGQHDPAEISVFMEEANSDRTPALIIGNRFSEPAGMPKVRYWTNRLMSGWISQLCGQAMPDTQCGYRLLRSDLLTKLNLSSTRYDYESEMIFAVGLSGKPISHVPVKTIYGEEKSKIHPVKDTLRFLKLMRHYGPACRKAKRARGKAARVLKKASRS